MWYRSYVSRARSSVNPFVKERLSADLLALVTSGVPAAAAV